MSILEHRLNIHVADHVTDHVTARVSHLGTKALV